MYLWVEHRAEHSIMEYPGRLSHVCSPGAPRYGCVCACVSTRPSWPPGAPGSPHANVARGRQRAGRAWGYYPGAPGPMWPEGDQMRVLAVRAQPTGPRQYTSTRAYVSWRPKLQTWPRRPGYSMMLCSALCSTQRCMSGRGRAIDMARSGSRGHHGGMPNPRVGGRPGGAMRRGVRR